jgi:hypothetical protein
VRLIGYCLMHPTIVSKTKSETMAIKLEDNNGPREKRSKAMTYALVIMVVGLNPAMTNIPGFTDRNVCINQGKALSDAAATSVSDYGKLITYCVEVK